MLIYACERMNIGARIQPNDDFTYGGIVCWNLVHFVFHGRRVVVSAEVAHVPLDADATGVRHALVSQG